jgi:histidinol-phosphate aminotransferase
MSGAAEATGAEEALRLVKPSVRSAAAYTLAPRRAAIKLDQNENPYGLPERLDREIRALASKLAWNRYPPFVPQRFVEAAAEASGWPEEGVLVGNGSNELIRALLAVTVRPGTAVVIPTPTFTLYRLMTEVEGGDPRPVPLRGDLTFDVDEIIREAVSSDAAVVVLCTPNNPTGSALTGAQIARIHNETGAIVVADQAYLEFGGDDARPLLEGRPRLVQLRTLSKALALAGLRAGYMLGDPALVREVSKAKLPYDVNVVTEAAAALVLRERAQLEETIDRIRTGRGGILRALREMRGVEPWPSAANFVLFRVLPPHRHDAVFERLREQHGVLVRDVSRYPMLEGCLRVSVGTEEENAAFLGALATVLEEGETDGT